MPDTLDPIFINCAGNTPPGLCEQVRELLALHDVRLTEEPTPQGYTLLIDEFERSQRATAVTASASAAEYNLRLGSTVSLFAPDKIPLLANASVTANEVYRYDEANVLAMRREQQELTQQLYQRLAQQIIYRLAPFDAQRVEDLRQAQQHQRQDTPAEVPAN